MRLFLKGALGALTLLAAWAHWPQAPLPGSARADRVVVRKAERVLEVYQGATLLRTYPISLGFAPEGDKQQEGDGRTPEGDYVLDERLEASMAHRALHVSYPDPADIASATERGVAPGGRIMIHGLRNGLGWLGRAHRFVDWTAGCIAVTNAEIRELWRVVPDGTLIVIEP
jgi:murein L,D-transpeptidase YafK